MAKPKSHTLFHFTKNIDSLCGILERGFLPRYCLEDISWLESDTTTSVALPIVCFCDIPLGRISDHIGFYGSFGIGLTKSWAIANGLNPLLYVSSTSTFSSHFTQLLKTFTPILEPKSEGESADVDYYLSPRHVVAFMKPLEGTIISNGEPISKDFYQESEWRYVAQPKGIPDFINGISFADQEFLKEKNLALAQECALSFSPSDVRYIFVSKDSEIPHLVNFVNTRLDRFPSADLKILTTRITSLESIEHDI